jgi:hypothetical protein
MTEAPDARAFYADRIPAQFNRAFAEQEDADEAGRRIYEDMRAVDATIRVEVEGEGGGVFFLNIDQGRMCAGDTPAYPPFLTLIQDRRAFEHLAREAGDSPFGLLGGLAGLAGDMKLTRRRIKKLAGVNGLIRFEVTGDDGFALRAHFGGDPIPSRADTHIRMDESAYQDLRSGRLDPQSAFMNMQIVVEGNMRMAVQLALAAVSRD